MGSFRAWVSILVSVICLSWMDQSAYAGAQTFYVWPFRISAASAQDRIDAFLQGKNLQGVAAARASAFCRWKNHGEASNYYAMPTSFVYDLESQKTETPVYHPIGNQMMPVSPYAFVSITCQESDGIDALLQALKQVQQPQVLKGAVKSQCDSPSAPRLEQTDEDLEEPPPPPVKKLAVVQGAVGKVVGEADLNNQITGTSKLVMVVIGSSTCPYSKKFDPTMTELASKYAGKMKVVQAMTQDEENNEIFEKYGATRTPTVLLFKNGKFVGDEHGRFVNETLDKLEEEVQGRL